MRTKAAAIAGSAGFLVIAPGVVAGLVPWWLTGWQQGAGWPAPVRAAGGLLITAGAATLLGSFAEFALEGRAPRRRRHRYSPSTWWCAGCTGTSVIPCTWR